MRFSDALDRVTWVNYYINRDDGLVNRQLGHITGKYLFYKDEDGDITVDGDDVDFLTILPFNVPLPFK